MWTKYKRFFGSMRLARLYCIQVRFTYVSLYVSVPASFSLFPFLPVLIPACFPLSLSLTLIYLLKYLLLSSSTISAAKTRPVIAEPEIHGSQSLDSVTGFLLLMSEGLINALESAHGPEQANQVSRFILTDFLTTSATFSLLVFLESFLISLLMFLVLLLQTAYSNHAFHLFHLNRLSLPFLSSSFLLCLLSASSTFY